MLGSQVLGDIHVEDRNDRFVFRNNALTVEVARNDGAWLAIHASGHAGNLIAPAKVPMDVQVGGEWLVARHGLAYLRHETTADAPRHAGRLSITYSIPNTDLDLTCIYTLHEGDGRLERSARLVRRATPGAPDCKLERFAFHTPGLRIGNAADCAVNTPGPFWPGNFIAPDSPLESLAGKTIALHAAPDGGFGLAAITNARQKLTVASWVDTKGEVSYGTTLTCDGARLTIQHDDNRAQWLPANGIAQSSVQRIEIVPGALPLVLEKYREMFAAELPLAPTPDWVRNMVLLEIFPSYYQDGFKGITQRLADYKEIGFNTIYLMPHWSGGYSPLDPFEVDPKYGTAADLKELVKAAHELGLRVLFDMVIHGFHEKSPVIKAHPEYFIHDQDGSLALHPTWKSTSTDWASPAYQRYMADLVRHDLKKYGIDGYRVDAASYKAPSWQRGVPYPAWKSGSCAPELMKIMLNALRETKPDAVLLSEVFGPVWYNVCNLVHDNQTEGAQFLIEKMEKGEYTAAHYKLHIANVLDGVPAGANRVYYARNHDTSWFYHFNDYTPRFMALDAIHALVAIPSVFAGDPGNGPHPDSDRGTYTYYRKLFALRRDFPELARGDVLLREVQCDNPWVFTAVRRLKGKSVFIAVSLSDKPQTATVTLKAKDVPKTLTRATLTDPISGQTVKGAKRLSLGPCQVLVGRVR